MDELNCDEVERLRLALSWMGCATPQGLEACCVRQGDLVRDLISAVLAHKKGHLEAADAMEQQRQDAARYQWLRHGDNDECCLGFSLEARCGTDDVWLLRNGELDAAIDAAMAQTHNTKVSGLPRTGETE